MSVLQYPETIDDPDLQIWTNAAFDNEDSGESTTTTTTTAIKASWCPLQPIFLNQSETFFDSNSFKENKTPLFNKSLPSVNSPMPIKLLQSNTVSGNSQGKPIKLLFKQGLRSPTSMVTKTGERGSCDGSKIDTEIEEIKSEINRLASKLEALRLQKEEQNLKTTDEKRGGGRIVSAKFMEPKQSLNKSPPSPKKNKEAVAVVSNKGKSQRRGVSLGPSEIYGSARSRHVVVMKPENTPIPSTQYRRKSCFWKVQEVNEDKVTTERGGGGRSKSLSPLARRRPVSKQQAPPKQALTTVGSKKHVKKEEGIISSVQPKKLLFKEGEKSIGAKKQPTRNGRVVASRYNQISEQRKRTLPENDKEESRKIDKKRASSVGKSRAAFLPECNHHRSNLTECRVKKRWEIPREEAMRNKNLVTSSSPTSILNMVDLQPKNRTLQSIKNSPRDSGAAKKVAAELTTGNKSYFGASEEKKEVNKSVCQVLNFEEEEEE